MTLALLDLAFICKSETNQWVMMSDTHLLFFVLIHISPSNMIVIYHFICLLLFQCLIMIWAILTFEKFVSQLQDKERNSIKLEMYSLCCLVVFAEEKVSRVVCCFHSMAKIQCQQMFFFSDYLTQPNQTMLTLHNCFFGVVFP